ncbi:MAG: DUF1080 domain-containing protein [Gemmatales bacterium]|nr:DUF1080 domain-containing protein [Gemmatales bacterium]MCS7161688.1 DUF1080 domain-containing protein [Gemmatales bacterium]MDW8176891.1 DUF1080 domain-containing protein [Gemmatales bacterium]MDW8222713.1 DUF1080 domain-containing protein [Gemmatales bacterium]
MRRWFWLLGGIALSCGLALPVDNTLTQEEQAQGWKLLFNGRDLTGWGLRNKKPPAPHWQVEDGAIVLKKSGGDLVYWAEAFEDFHLSLEWKTTGNSGIFLRSGIPDVPWHYLEIAIAGPVDRKSIPREHANGALYSLAPASPLARTLEGWNHFYIICDGPIIACTLNGVETFRVDFREEKWKQPQGKCKLIYASLPRRGYIAFQDHGAEIAFRNVKLKPLR